VEASADRRQIRVNSATSRRKVRVAGRQEPADGVWRYFDGDPPVISRQPRRANVVPLRELGMKVGDSRFRGRTAMLKSRRYQVDESRSTNTLRRRMGSAQGRGCSIHQPYDPRSTARVADGRRAKQDCRRCRCQGLSAWSETSLPNVPSCSSTRRDREAPRTEIAQILAKGNRHTISFAPFSKISSQPPSKQGWQAG